MDKIVPSVIRQSDRLVAAAVQETLGNYLDGFLLGNVCCWVVSTNLAHRDCVVFDRNQIFTLLTGIGQTSKITRRIFILT